MRGAQVVLRSIRPVFSSVFEELLVVVLSPELRAKGAVRVSDLLVLLLLYLLVDRMAFFETAVMKMLLQLMLWVSPAE